MTRSSGTKPTKTSVSNQLKERLDPFFSKEIGLLDLIVINEIINQNEPDDDKLIDNQHTH
jgi:hypothetical protein